MGRFIDREEGKEIFASFFDDVLCCRDVDSYILESVKEDGLSFIEALIYLQIDFMQNLPLFISRLKFYDLGDGDYNYNEGQNRLTKFKAPASWYEITESEKISETEVAEIKKAFSENREKFKTKIYQ